MQEVLALLTGEDLLMACLLYSSGLRLMECLRLRVHNVEFELRQIAVRDANGGQDRVTMLPQAIVPDLQEHMIHVRALHNLGLRQGRSCVYRPDTLAREYPNASTEWG